MHHKKPRDSPPCLGAIDILQHFLPRSAHYPVNHTVTPGAFQLIEGPPFFTVKPELRPYQHQIIPGGANPFDWTHSLADGKEASDSAGASGAACWPPLAAGFSDAGRRPKSS